MSIAIYPGSFDPITSGHVSVIRQAVKLFSHLRILIAVNPDKKTAFSVEDRVEMISGSVMMIPNISIAYTSLYVVEYARMISASFLVRGIRGESDAKFETILAWENKKLAPEITTIFLPAEANLSEISSSKLKEKIRAGEDVSQYCDPIVEQKLKHVLRNTAQHSDHRS